MDRRHHQGTPNSRQYTNQHDQTNLTAGKTLAGLTGGGHEHNFDGYTKIAGEGARWQCVRNHAGKLQNNTVFYTAASDTHVRGVTFAQLWLNWVASFGPRYDISDADVVKAIKGQIKGKATKKYPTPSSPLQGLSTLVAKTSLTDQDYDLDAGQGHVVPQPQTTTQQTTPQQPNQTTESTPNPTTQSPPPSNEQTSKPQVSSDPPQQPPLTVDDTPIDPPSEAPSEAPKDTVGQIGETNTRPSGPSGPTTQPDAPRLDSVPSRTNPVKPPGELPSNTLGPPTETTQSDETGQQTIDGTAPKQTTNPTTSTTEDK